MVKVKRVVVVLFVMSALIMVVPVEKFLVHADCSSNTWGYNQGSLTGSTCWNGYLECSPDGHTSTGYCEIDMCEATDCGYSQNGQYAFCVNPNFCYEYPGCRMC